VALDRLVLTRSSLEEGSWLEEKRASGTPHHPGLICHHDKQEAQDVELPF
jgi:hypothetical protein